MRVLRIMAVGRVAKFLPRPTGKNWSFHGGDREKHPGKRSYSDRSTLDQVRRHDLRTPVRAPVRLRRSPRQLAPRDDVGERHREEQRNALRRSDPTKPKQ